MSIFTFGTLSGITWSKDDVEKYALDEKLKKRLNDGLDHIQRVLVCPMVLPPITLKGNYFVTGIKAFSNRPNIYQKAQRTGGLSFISKVIASVVIS